GQRTLHLHGPSDGVRAGMIRSGRLALVVGLLAVEALEDVALTVQELQLDRALRLFLQPVAQLDAAGWVVAGVDEGHLAGAVVVLLDGVGLDEAASEGGVDPDRKSVG